MAAFTQRKQGLHDLICDTLVVDKWAFINTPELQCADLGTVTIVILVLGATLTVLLLGLLFVGIGAILASQ